LHLSLNVSRSGKGRQKWIIEYLELEVSGHTE
jgi:hypothetical protein